MENEAEMNPALRGVPLRFQEGAGALAEQERQEEQQRSLGEVALDTLDQSVANSAFEYMADLPGNIAARREHGVQDLEQYRQELTQGLPVHLHDNVMRNSTYTAAKAHADRIREDEDAKLKLAQQVGISRTAVQLAAGLIDADLPLIFASGGTVAAGRTALSVARATKTLTGSTALSRVAGDAAVGLTGGALAGGIVGAGGMAFRDDYDVQSLWHSVLAGAATGGALNPVIGRVLPDRDVWEQAAQQEMADAINAAERDLFRQERDPDSPLNDQSRPVDYGIPDNPLRVLFNQGRDPDSPEGGPTGVGAADRGSAGRAFDIETELANVREYRKWKPKSGNPQPAIKPWTKKLLDEGASEQEIAMSYRIREHLDDVQFDKRLQEDMKNPVVKLLVGGSDYKVKVGNKDVPVGYALGQFFTLGTREFTTLVHSKAPAAKWIASEILASASGLGRQGMSAAAHKEAIFYSARTHVANSFLEARAAFYAGQRGKLPQMYKNDAEFSAELRLALDARRQGQEVPEQFKKVVDDIDRMNDELMERMRGADEETSVLGSREVTANPGYFRYDIVPEKVLKAVRESSEKAVTDAFARAYRKRNPSLTKKLANRVAKAVVRRRLNQARGIDAADRQRLTRNVSSNIEQVLIDEGVNEADRAAIMKVLGKQEEGRATASYLRDRVEMDLRETIPGTNYRMVDLFSDDIETSMLRYAHDAAGSAALASKGLRSSADVDNLVNLLGRESTALGEAVDPERVHGMFSQFTGGTHVGVDPLTGRATPGVSAATSGLTSATRASLLQRLGLTTVMDMANVVATNGVRRSVGAAIEQMNMHKMPKSRARAIQRGLEDIRFLTGQDHLVYRSHLSVEELDADRVNFGQSILNGVRNIENFTYYMSGHHHVLKFGQRVAADATFSHLVAGLRGEADGMTARAMQDMGLTQETISELDGLVRAGDIDLRSENPRVELGGLSKKAQDELSAGMYVAINQQLQRGMIGETSMWMNSDIGKLLSTLKTFGILATQKQLARRLMVGGKPDVAYAAAWQIGFAYAVLAASHAVQGTEMSPGDRARLAVVYTPVLGIGPTTVDPIMNMLGFDSLHFSPYGRYSSPLNSPVIETVEKLSKAPGSIADLALPGDGNYNDMQNARSMFFLNWYGMKRLWEAM